jgi:hypothetical protein
MVIERYRAGDTGIPKTEQLSPGGRNLKQSLDTGFPLGGSRVRVDPPLPGWERYHFVSSEAVISTHDLLTRVNHDSFFSGHNYSSLAM